MIPTAAMAAIGSFTSTTATPAVTGTNSATVANAKGVAGSASAVSAGVARYGVTGNAGGTLGVGVQGTGTKYGVFSNGPLGVASGKALSCTGCVGVGALSNAAGRSRAYAYVDDDGTVESGRSRNISVTNPDTGIYCITVSNVDVNTAAPLVTVSDTAYTFGPWTAKVTFDFSWVSPGFCSGSFMVVLTQWDQGGGDWLFANNDFTIVIP